MSVLKPRHVRRPRATTTAARRALVWLAGAVLLAWSAVPTLAQEDKLPSAEKIMEKSIEAQGGRAAFEKLTSRVSKGSIEVSMGEQNQKGGVTAYAQAPNKRYVEMTFGEQKVERGTDGDVFWELSPRGASIKEGEEREIQIRRSRFNSLLYWRENYEKVETIGKVDVDGRSCYEVELTPKVGARETVYFDRKTGLPVKMETSEQTPAGNVAVESFQEDYREVDGVKLPFKTVQKIAVMGQTQTITTIWQSIKHNEAIPPARFELPDKIKELSRGGEKPASPPAPKPKG